jgi:hypothetical protein
MTRIERALLRKDKRAMNKYFTGLLGAALCGVALLLAQTAYADCGGGCGSGCGSQCDNHCCPRCGCPMTPQCHLGCEMKKVTDYKYCCKCKDICIPGVTPCLGRGDCCEPCVKCCVRTVHELVKIPVTKEVPTRTSSVTWFCPRCQPCPVEGGSAAPQAAPTAPVPPAPRALPPIPPAPPKSTGLAPLPADLGALNP